MYFIRKKDYQKIEERLAYSHAKLAETQNDKIYNSIYKIKQSLKYIENDEAKEKLEECITLLNDSIDDIRLKSGNQVRYLGEWHSHPKGSSSPSTTDKKQFKDMSEQLGSEDVPFVQLIYGNDGIYVNAII